MLILEHCDGLRLATLLIQAPQLEPGLWRILVVGMGGMLVPDEDSPGHPPAAPALLHS